MKSLLSGIAASFALLSAASAADLSPQAFVKAPFAAPTSNWTGFYLGGTIGGGWGRSGTTYAGNDVASTGIIAGTFGFPGQQALAPHGINSSGIAGGVELGYNWQMDPRWLVGLEADFSGSDVKGSGRGTSVLSTAAAGFTQTFSAGQSVDWWGTARARLGFLPHNNLLLFGTGGFAYGRVSATDSYTPNGAPVFFGAGGGMFAGGSFNCTMNVTCFSGSTATVKTGWTVGGGGEWRVAPQWSIKAEYVYTDLGRISVTSVAVNVLAPGFAPSRYTASFQQDFHVARVGVNYRF